MVKHRMIARSMSISEQSYFVIGGGYYVIYNGFRFEHCTYVNGLMVVSALRW